MLPSANADFAALLVDRLPPGREMQATSPSAGLAARKSRCPCIGADRERRVERVAQPASDAQRSGEARLRRSAAAAGSVRDSRSARTPKIDADTLCLGAGDCVRERGIGGAVVLDLALDVEIEGDRRHARRPPDGRSTSHDPIATREVRPNLRSRFSLSSSIVTSSTGDSGGEPANRSPSHML